ncbi:MAG: terminase small subunit [Clostridia bacterium]|nr:terminase small subunit [Clostridia bacterium]
MSVLTEQRKMFVEEYLKLRCKNATQAAINAGYSPKTAQSQASQILKDSNVSEYLEQRKSEIIQELHQEFFFDALEARKAMYNILISEKAKYSDKIAVAKDFLDRAGFKPTDNVNVEGNLNVKENPYDQLTVDELRALARKCEADEQST